MKIAMMTNNYKPFVGGVPISIERLSNSLAERGEEVTIFAPTYHHSAGQPQGSQPKDNQAQSKQPLGNQPGKSEVGGNVSILRYAALMQRFVGGIVLPNPWDPMIEREFRKQSYDIIHVHHPMMIGWSAIKLSLKYQIPLVFTYHTRYEQYVKAYASCFPFAEKLIPFYTRFFLKYCRHVIAPTPGMKEYLVRELHCKEEQVSVLPTGIDLKPFQSAADEAAALRAQYTGPVFLSVSRMANEKNLFFLLESIAAFKAKYQKPFTVLLVGEGPQLAEYKAYSKKLQIEEEVIFIGNVANEVIAAYYRAADYFLFASKTETQGIVILEAFAGGCPVIAVDATGVRDLVESGKNGFLCKEDTEDFSEKMHSLLTKESDLYHQLSQNAERTAALYSKEAVATAAINLYNRITADAVQSRTGTLKNLRNKARKLLWNSNIIF